MKIGQGYVSLPVAVVLMAILYIYLTTVLVFVDRWFGLATSHGILNAAAFTAVASVCVYTYALAVLRDPGRVPPSYLPDVEDSNSPIHEIKRKVGIPLRLMLDPVPALRFYILIPHRLMCFWGLVSGFVKDLVGNQLNGDLRYCQKCSQYKPPRSHHCRSCKRCVLRMDHHCIWINNCVGHANYKVFFVFIVYAVIACFYSLVLLVGSLTVDLPEDEQQSGSSSRTIYVISGILVVPTSVALASLLGWHIYLVFQNKTTIEYHEGVRAMWLAEKGGTVYKHPYDISGYENLTTVLGPNIFCWLCPTSGHIGSGLRFRTAYDSSVS